MYLEKCQCFIHLTEREREKEREYLINVGGLFPFFQACKYSLIKKSKKITHLKLFVDCVQNSLLLHKKAMNKCSACMILLILFIIIQ